MRNYFKQVVSIDWDLENLTGLANRYVIYLLSLSFGEAESWIVKCILILIFADIYYYCLKIEKTKIKIDPKHDAEEHELQFGESQSAGRRGGCGDVRDARRTWRARPQIGAAGHNLFLRR